MSHAYLILCHTPPYHIATLAACHPEHHYYIHYDLKCSMTKLDFLRNLANVHILSNRVSVNWGGFSMILATLNLFQAALSHPHNRYFHLMSGDCAPLATAETIEAEFAQYGNNTLFLQCENVPHLRYRLRFSAPHADTTWQRSFIGKILTKIMQLADKIVPSQQMAWQGSQWFSADRTALQMLFDASLGEPSDYFAKKLVPDEHFFQYIVTELLPETCHFINNNHRFVRIPVGGNHADFLSLDELWAAQRNGAWFARKVSPEHMARFLHYETEK